MRLQSFINFDAAVLEEMWSFLSQPHKESSIIGVPGRGLAYRSKSCTANQQPSAVEKSDVIAAYSAAMLGQKVARAQPPPGTPIILDSDIFIFKNFETF